MVKADFYIHKTSGILAYIFQKDGETLILERESDFMEATYHPTTQELKEFRRLKPGELQKLLNNIDSEDKSEKRQAEWLKRKQEQIRTGEIHQYTSSL
ncbi:hypothetical protein JXA48_05285 [Candidatus Woesearchaeota archaeon]|nr:hypothetical protein [Candidatus Woesearchaeota archaeon]